MIFGLFKNKKKELAKQIYGAFRPKIDVSKKIGKWKDNLSYGDAFINDDYLLGFFNMYANIVSRKFGFAGKDSGEIIQDIYEIMDPSFSDIVKLRRLFDRYHLLSTSKTKDFILGSDHAAMFFLVLVNDKESLKVLLGDNFEAVTKQMREIIYKQNKLADGIVTQAQRGNSKEFADNLINKSQGKGKIGLEKEFDGIISDLGGVDSNGADVVRYHVINGMLQKAQTIVDKAGKNAFSDTIDPKILRNEIRQLQQNPYLMKFFDEKQII